MPPVTIPMFDGRPVDLAHNAFSGSDETPPYIADPGEEVYLTIRGTTSSVSHKEDRFGRLVRVQSIRVTASMVADEATVSDIRAEMKRREDEAAGQETLDVAIDAVVTERDDDV